MLCRRQKFCTRHHLEGVLLCGCLKYCFVYAFNYCFYSKIVCSCFDSACLLAWQICPYQLVCNTSWGNVFLSLRDIITFITSLIGLWALPAIGQASAFKFVKNGSGAEVWISSASCAPSSWIKTRLVILFVNTEIRIDVLAYHVVFSIVRISPPPPTFWAAIQSPMLPNMMCMFLAYWTTIQVAHVTCRDV